MNIIEKLIKKWLDLGYIKAMILSFVAIVMITFVVSIFFALDFLLAFVIVGWAVFCIALISSPYVIAIAIAHGFETALSKMISKGKK